MGGVALNSNENVTLLGMTFTFMLCVCVCVDMHMCNDNTSVVVLSFHRMDSADKPRLSGTVPSGLYLLSHLTNILFSFMLNFCFVFFFISTTKIRLI